MQIKNKAGFQNFRPEVVKGNLQLRYRGHENGSLGSNFRRVVIVDTKPLGLNYIGVLFESLLQCTADLLVLFVIILIEKISLNTRPKKTVYEDSTKEFDLSRSSRMVLASRPRKRESGFLLPSRNHIFRNTSENLKLLIMGSRITD